MLKKSMCFMLGMAVLLVMAYFIPTIVTVAEDNALKKEAKYYTIESVDITPKETSFYNELQEFPMMLGSMMYVGNIKSMTQEEVLAIEMEFLQTIGLNIVYENLKYHEESVYLTTAADYETVYFVWQCILVDEFGWEYQVWIDDETQKVLGFSVANYMEAVSVNQDGQQQYSTDPLKMLVDSMTEYYDFASGEIVFNELYGGNMIAFYDSDGKEQLALSLTLQGAHLLCNLSEMPGYSVYSVDDTVSEEEKMKLKQ